jgi:hypothetical protein
MVKLSLFLRRAHYKRGAMRDQDDAGRCGCVAEVAVVVAEGGQADAMRVAPVVVAGCSLVERTACGGSVLCCGGATHYLAWTVVHKARASASHLALHGHNLYGNARTF